MPTFDVMAATAFLVWFCAALAVATTARERRKARAEEDDLESWLASLSEVEDR